MTLIDDQTDLRAKLEATADLVDAGVPLGAISARARTACPEADALIEAIHNDNEWRRECKGPATLVDQPLTAWIWSVEARLSKAVKDFGRNAPAPDAAGSGESEQRTAGVVQSQQARTVLPRDANTVVFEWVGEALKAEQEAKDTEPEKCGKCKTVLLRNGLWRTCSRCNQSWLGAERVRPLAQSSLVPESASETEASAELGAHELELARLRERNCELERMVVELNQECGLRARLQYESDDRARELDDKVMELEANVERMKREGERELRARIVAAESTIETLRRDLMMRDLEIENLRAANELQRPAESTP